MKVFTIQDLQNWNACYNPSIVLPDNWSGTAIDMLNQTQIATTDRIWAVMRSDLLPDKQIRLFAAWCAKQIEQTDTRSIEAINIAENFANGLCSEDDRYTAEYNAWQAVSESSSALNTAATKSAAHSLVKSCKSAAQGASIWASANNDSQVKANIESDQITQAKLLFNNYGL